MPEVASRRIRCSTEQRRGRSVMDVIRRWVWVVIFGRLSVERIGIWWPAALSARAAHQVGSTYIRNLSLTFFC